MAATFRVGAENIAARFIAAAKIGKNHEETIIADCIDGSPLCEVEAALRAHGLHYHREPMKLHYRAPAELPKLVLDVALGGKAS